jgi:hypothetical protein
MPTRPTIWLLDEWDYSDAGRVIDLLHQKLPNSVEVRQLRLATALTPNTGDVVVLFPALEGTQLPEDAPPWLSRCSVITVIQHAEELTRVRPYLHDRNAFVRSRYGENWSGILADAALTSAALARQTRHAFISYRRSDGLGVARQIAGRLAQDGFFVFLDEQSIGVGQRFETEILYHLDDADVVILVATPELKHSAWVQREITFAASANIALLAVDCGYESGAHPIIGSAMADQRFRPGRIPGAGDQLDADDLESLMATVYGRRVSGIARRVQNLVGLVLEQRGVPVTAGERVGEFFEPPPSGDLLRVLPFRPTLEVLWQGRVRHPECSIHVLYPENMGNDSRIRALEWVLVNQAPGMDIAHVHDLWR